MKPKKGKKARIYDDNVIMLKSMLMGMIMMEEYMEYIAENQNLDILNMQWLTDDAEVEINDYIPERDVIYITAYVLPAKTEEGSVGDYIHYFYQVEGYKVKRELLISPDAAPIYSEGEQTLKELMSILFASLEMDVIMEARS